MAIRVEEVIPYAGETVYVSGCEEQKYERTSRGNWFFYIGSDTFILDEEEAYELEQAYQEFKHAPT